MDVRTWKKRIQGGLATSLEGELDNGSEWLFTDDKGEPLTEPDERRMRRAVAEVVDDLRRRAGE